MKRMISVCLMTAFLLTCCMGVASASSKVELYASSTLSYYEVNMVSGGKGSAYINFSVNSIKLADELGVKVIKIYKSNGDYVKTVYGSVSNGMIYQDGMCHNDFYEVSLTAEQAVNNILPTNFAVTIRDDWYYANLDPWMGTVDYSHDYSAWAGTANQPLQRHIAGDYYTGSIVYRFT